jgi:hypothetical protein
MDASSDGLTPHERGVMKERLFMTISRLTVRSSWGLCLAVTLLLGAAACGSRQEAPPAESASATEGEPNEAAQPAETTPEETPAAAPAPAPTMKPAPAPQPKAATPTPTPASVEGGGQAPAAETPPPPPEPQFTMVRLGAGKRLPVVTDRDLSSKTSQVGETFTAKVTKNITKLNSTDTVIPEGSIVNGTVIEAQPAKQFSGNAKLALKFDRLVLPSGETVPLVASLAQMGEDTKGRTKKGIAGGAVAGALLGTIVGRNAKGALIGGAVGAGVGTAIVAGSDNKDVTIPAGSQLVLEADQPIDVPVPKG